MTDNRRATLSFEAHIRKGAQALTTSPTPSLDARILMKHAAGLDDGAMIARSSEIPTSETLLAFGEAIERRRNEEPIAYIIGSHEFWSLNFKVSPEVLIPRPDSECLIETVLDARSDKQQPLRILDLGTGSGCLLIALLSEYPNATGIGVDASLSALQIATDNARRLGIGERVNFIRSDWCEKVEGVFDVILANPPYICDGDILPNSVREFEPADALFAGRDGLDAYRSILPQLEKHLRDHTILIGECASTQVKPLAAMVSETLPSAEIAPIFDLESKPRGVFCKIFAT